MESGLIMRGGKSLLAQFRNWLFVLRISRLITQTYTLETSSTATGSTAIRNSTTCVIPEKTTQLKCGTVPLLTPRRFGTINEMMSPRFINELQHRHIESIRATGIEVWIHDALQCGFSCCPECILKVVMNPSLPHSLLNYLVKEERYEDAAFLKYQVERFWNKLETMPMRDRVYPPCNNYTDENYNGL